MWYEVLLQLHVLHLFIKGGKETNSSKRLLSKSSLCKNSQQLVVTGPCYLQRVYRLAEVWEYIIKITLWHWDLTASIFWCNLSSCFSRPDICYGSADPDGNAGLSFSNGAQRSYLAVIIFIRCRGERKQPHSLKKYLVWDQAWIEANFLATCGCTFQISRFIKKIRSREK